MKRVLQDRDFSKCNRYLYFNLAEVHRDMGQKFRILLWLICWTRIIEGGKLDKRRFLSSVTSFAFVHTLNWFCGIVG